MSSTRIPSRLRRAVLVRAAGLCAFCRCAEELMGVTFEVDHIIPRAAGGATTLANLCLCCPTCNRHKAARTHASDPITGAMTPLFHPARDAWDEHFEWHDEGSVLVGRTMAGRATVDALRMNRPQIVELRRYWGATGHHPRSTGAG